MSTDLIKLANYISTEFIHGKEVVDVRFGPHVFEAYLIFADKTEVGVSGLFVAKLRKTINTGK